MTTLSQLPALNRFYQSLPNWYTALGAEKLPSPALVHANLELAEKFGLSEADCASPDFVHLVAGNQFPDWVQPLATVYSGHQFGVCVPRLGDGRALLLGEVESTTGFSYEWQLKGAGRTPYSRHADGRAVLRSSIREYLCSEAMHGLGIPTTRALAMIASPAAVYRETTESAAVVLRVAQRFVRFGHFEYAFLQNDLDGAKALADFLIEHDLPECQDKENPYLSMLETVVHRTASLIADWQAVGFCHGVMNTDNMSILGLTIDYGPFGFLDQFDPNHICNHSDTYGRYAFQQQPAVAYWNLRVLGSVLLPLIGDKDITIECLDRFPSLYQHAYETRMGAKLGLDAWLGEVDGKLLTDVLALLAKHRVDYTRFWRAVCQVNASDTNGDAAVLDEFIDRAAASEWLNQYRHRLQQQSSNDANRQAQMKRVNPKFVLRNYLAEEAIRQSRDEQNYQQIDELMQVLANPYDEHPAFERFASHPPTWASHLEVSCSS